jgi:hypothetical protein
MTISDQLRALAESLEGDQWEHPICSREVCVKAADLLDRARDARRAELLLQMERRKLLAGFRWNDFREHVEREQVETILEFEFDELTQGG